MGGENRCVSFNEWAHEWNLNHMMWSKEPGYSRYLLSELA